MEKSPSCIGYKMDSSGSSANRFDGFHPIGDDLSPSGHVAMSGDTVGWHNGEALLGPSE